MKKIILLIISLLLTAGLQSQALREIGETLSEKVLKVVGKNTFESSTKILKRELGGEFFEKLTKQYDDDILEKLAKNISKNKKLKTLFLSDKNAIKVWKLLGNTKASERVEVIEYFSKIMKRQGEEKFMNRYLFKEAGEKLVIKTKNQKVKKVLAVIEEVDNDIIIRAKRGKGGTDLNDILNQVNLIPNSIYKINNEVLKTTEKGDLKEISGVLFRKAKENIKRNKNIQRKAVYKKGGKSTDQGGHLIANTLGGSSEMYNIVPMSRNLNLGQYSRLENLWKKALENRKKVDYKINLIYEGNSQRPSKFQITYLIEGEKRKTLILDNN